MKDDLEGLLPLSPATFYILLALSDEDRHGYGIMQEVARQSEGKYKLGPGTFYDNLEKLIEHRCRQGSASKVRKRRPSTALLPNDGIWP